MDRIKLIHYQGVEIIFKDFSNCTIEESIESMKEAEHLIQSYPEDVALTLTNVKNARYNHQTVEMLKELLKKNDLHVKKGAIVGVDKLKKIIYNSVMKLSGRHLAKFDNIEEAKDWLVDRRKFPRIKEKISVEYSVLGPNNRKGKGVTKDISMGGICLICSEKIEKQSLVSLKIYLSDFQLPVIVKGIVAWSSSFLSGDKEEGPYLGIEFIEVDPIARARLFEYIFKYFNPEGEEILGN